MHKVHEKPFKGFTREGIASRIWASHNAGGFAYAVGPKGICGIAVGFPEPESKTLHIAHLLSDRMGLQMLIAEFFKRFSSDWLLSYKREEGGQFFLRELTKSQTIKVLRLLYG